MASYTENFAALGNENPLNQSGKWSTLTGGGLQISSAKAIGTSTTSASAITATAATIAANQTVEITLATTGNNDNPGIVLRSGAGVAYGIFYFNSVSELRWYKLSAGTWGFQGTQTGVSLTAGNVLSAAVVTSGPNADFTVKKNGSTVWTFSDTASVIASGQPGAFHENGNVGASGITLFYAFDDAGGGQVLVPFTRRRSSFLLVPA